MSQWKDAWACEKGQHETSAYSRVYSKPYQHGRRKMGNNCTILLRIGLLYHTRTIMAKIKSALVLHGLNWSLHCGSAAKHLSPPAYHLYHGCVSWLRKPLKLLSEIDLVALKSIAALKPAPWHLQLESATVGLFTQNYDLNSKAEHPWRGFPYNTGTSCH